MRQAYRFNQWVRCVLVSSAWMFPCIVNAEVNSAGLEENIVKIRFIFDDCSVLGTLKSSASTDDFVRQLPLTLDLQDYANTEKIAYLPNKLTREGAPSGTQSKAGDISYYAPWGNLVIFYKDFGYASGLIKLGQIDDGINCFISKETNRVTIEKVN